MSQLPGVHSLLISWIRHGTTRNAPEFENSAVTMQVCPEKPGDQHRRSVTSHSPRAAAVEKEKGVSVAPTCGANSQQSAV